MQVLLVNDDDGHVARLITPRLESGNCQVEIMSKDRLSNETLSRASIVLISVQATDAHPLQICRQIRSMSDIPIIMLSIDANSSQRTVGIRSGADDYVQMPLDVGELMARIRAVLRRTSAMTTPRRWTFSTVVVDLDLQLVTVSGNRVNLTKKEFQVLALLADAAGSVCTRDRLIAELWGGPWTGAEKALNFHVTSLRSKIGERDLIETVRGVGYRLRLGTTLTRGCAVGQPTWQS
jgi:DNA-binding response OmpR family regulator